MVSLAPRRLALMAPALAIAAAGFLMPAAAAQANPSPRIHSASSVIPVVHLPGEYPESITSDRWGNLYLGLFTKGQILKITPFGGRSVLATFPAGSQTLGVRAGPDGDIYAAVANSDADLSGVWRVSASGHFQEKIATIAGFPNGLAFGTDGSLFVSESIGGAIYRIGRGGGPARLWSDSPLLKGTAGQTRCGTHFSGLPIGANGLAFGPGELLVANTTESAIVRIPVRPDGMAGTASLFVPQDCRLWGADGMTTDHWGNLYVAANAAQNIDRVFPDGRVQVLAAKQAGDALYTPSDVTFGPGWWERPALFISNFALAYPGGEGGGVAKLPLGFGWPPRH